MSDPTQPDREEQLFADSLQDGIRHLRFERGACPSSEELVLFFEGRLASEDASRIQSHVDACGLCDLVLSRLKRGTDRRVPDPAFRGQRTWGHLWNPLAAYGLAALLAYPAYLGLRQQLGPKAMIEPIAAAMSVPSFSLDTVRGPEKPGQPDVLKLTDQNKSFVLEFFVPMKSDRHYFAEIRDGSGRMTVGRSAIVDGGSPGRVALVCNREAFAPGYYALTVTEEDSARQRFEYAFQIP